MCQQPPIRKKNKPTNLAIPPLTLRRRANPPINAENILEIVRQKVHAGLPVRLLLERDIARRAALGNGKHGDVEEAARVAADSVLPSGVDAARVAGAVDAVLGVDVKGGLEWGDAVFGVDEHRDAGFQRLGVVGLGGARVDGCAWAGDLEGVADAVDLSGAGDLEAVVCVVCSFQDVDV